MILTQQVTADLTRKNEAPVADTVQGDTARNIRVSLTADGSSWPVPAGAAILVRYRKPDGTGGTYDTLPSGKKAWAVSGSTVTLNLAPQVVSVAGMVVLQMAILKEQDVLSTFDVGLRVHPDPSLGVLDSEDYVSIGQWCLPQAIEAAEKALSAASRAETAARQAELIAKSVTCRMDLSFTLGSINTSTGTNADSTVRIRSGYFPMLQPTVGVVMPGNVKGRLVFYNRNLVCLDESSEPMTGFFQHTNPDAAYARLFVGYSDDRVISNVSALAELIAVYMPSEH